MALVNERCLSAAGQQRAIEVGCGRVARSSTLSTTTSQPRSLLSTAKLNIARSLVRPSICNLVLINETCFGRSGGFGPISLPLFQSTRLG
jgi:hypothetical protein